MTDQCPTPNKRPYTDPDWAERDAKNLRRMGAANETAYRCPGGGHWHVGSSTPHSEGVPPKRSASDRGKWVKGGRKRRRGGNQRWR